MSKQVELSIVIPTYNERENIQQLIKSIAKVFPKIVYEIIVVDDRSPDKTGESAQEMVLSGHPVRVIYKDKKEGIGAALRVGYNASYGDFIASIDADLSFRVQDLKRLYENMSNGADLVVGSRHSKNSFYEIPNSVIRKKYFISKCGNQFLRFVTGIPLHDFSANFRMIRKDVWASICTKENRNFLLFEMILKAWVCGFQVEEIPVSFFDRRLGQSKLHLSTEVPKFLFKLCVYLFQHAAVLYGKRPLKSQIGIYIKEGVHS